MRAYGAIPSQNGWTVGWCSAEYRDMHKVSNVREFATFEEADQVARDIAQGKYGFIAKGGEYVNMR